MKIVYFFAFVAAISGASDAKRGLTSLVNDLGYEVTFPDCWTASKDDDGSGDRVTNASAIGLDPSEKCNLDEGIFKRRGVGISVGKEFKPGSEWREAYRIALDYYKTKVDPIMPTLASRAIDGKNQKSIWVVEKYGATKARWSLYVYCPERLVLVGAAATESLDDKLIKKFKNGDLFLPEPEKTIAESVICRKGKVVDPANPRQ